MNIVFNSAATDPIRAILSAREDSVLAIIAGVEGPSYRPLGATMAVMSDGTRVGTLSSGCIEADIALHAIEALKNNTPRLIRYGAGSPFLDIELPCGGGLDILLVPRPDTSALADINSGAMVVRNTGMTARNNTSLAVRFDPDIRFLVFGKGPEASTFAALVKSAGYPIFLLSPDEETLQASNRTNCQTRHLKTQAVPNDIDVDDRTVIVLFFHDHDWEPPILHWALQTNAFYIGSQGSLRARNARDLALEKMGVATSDIERLRGPIGLIPSARDAGTLAVSVLAEILAVAKNEPH